MSKRSSSTARPLTASYLTHADIIAGGKIIFYMADKPIKK